MGDVEHLRSSAEIQECIIITKLGKCLVKCAMRPPSRGFSRFKTQSLCNLLATMQKFASGVLVTSCSMHGRTIILAEGNLVVSALICEGAQHLASLKLKAQQVVHTFENAYVRILNELVELDASDREARLSTYTAGEIDGPATPPAPIGTFPEFLPFERTYLRPLLGEGPYEEGWLGSLGKLPGVLRTLLVSASEGTILLDRKRLKADGFAMAGGDEKHLQHLEAVASPLTRPVWTAVLKHLQHLCDQQQRSLLKDSTPRPDFVLLGFNETNPPMAVCVRIVPNMFPTACLVLFCLSEKNLPFAPISSAALDNSSKLSASGVSLNEGMSVQRGFESSNGTSGMSHKANSGYVVGVDDHWLSIYLRRTLSATVNVISQAYTKYTSPDLLIIPPEENNSVLLSYPDSEAPPLTLPLPPVVVPSGSSPGVSTGTVSSFPLDLADTTERSTRDSALFSDIAAQQQQQQMPLVPRPPSEKRPSYARTVLVEDPSYESPRPPEYALKKDSISQAAPRVQAAGPPPPHRPLPFVKVRRVATAEDHLAAPPPPPASASAPMPQPTKLVYPSGAFASPPLSPPHPERLFSGSSFDFSNANAVATLDGNGTLPSSYANPPHPPPPASPMLPFFEEAPQQPTTPNFSPSPTQPYPPPATPPSSSSSSLIPHHHQSLAQQQRMSTPPSPYPSTPPRLSTASSLHQLPPLPTSPPLPLMSMSRNPFPPPLDPLSPPNAEPLTPPHPSSHPSSRPTSRSSSRPQSRSSSSRGLSRQSSRRRLKRDLGGGTDDQNDNTVLSPSDLQDQLNKVQDVVTKDYGLGPPPAPAIELLSAEPFVVDKSSSSSARAFRTDPYSVSSESLLRLPPSPSPTPPNSKQIMLTSPPPPPTVYASELSVGSISPRSSASSGSSRTVQLARPASRTGSKTPLPMENGGDLVRRMGSFATRVPVASGPGRPRGADDRPSTEEDSGHSDEEGALRTGDAYARNLFLVTGRTPSNRRVSSFDNLSAVNMQEV